MAGLRQHWRDSCCPRNATAQTTMNTKNLKRRKSVLASIYDLSTPLVDKYYREMRKRVRFPRYYKKALNW